MPRPQRFRKVSFRPESLYFKPRGIPLSSLHEVVVGLDELEALRLADFEGMYQDAAATSMGVSRQTFARIVASARRKVAEALIEGKALKLEGGRVALVARNFRCLDCKHVWEVPFGTGRPDKCPGCGSVNFHRVAEDGDQVIRGRGRGGRCRRSGEGQETGKGRGRHQDGS